MYNYPGPPHLTIAVGRIKESYVRYSMCRSQVTEAWAADDIYCCILFYTYDCNSKDIQAVNNFL